MDNKKVLLLLLLLFLAGTVFASGLFDSFRKRGSQNTEEVPSDLDNASENQSGADTEDNSVVSPDLVLENGSEVDGEPSFELLDTDTGKIFFQHLSWDAAEYAFSYLVTLERKRPETDTFAEVLKESVREPYLDISVPPGVYRYNVESYNIMGTPDEKSAWLEFTILQAFHPTIISFSPEAFYFDRPSARIITLTGENLVLDAEIYLVSKTMFDETGAPFILRPREVYLNQLGENAELLFLEEDLIAGEYDFVVKNPGGRESTTGVFSIAVAKPYDINVSGGYSPMLTVFGQKDYILDHTLVPLSFSARGSFVPFKQPYGNFGFELNVSWSFLSAMDKIWGYKTSMHLVTVNAGGLFQYWIVPKALSVNARLGMGISGFFDFHFDYDTGKSGDSMNSSAFSFSAGASVQWLFYKQFFVEGGVDYAHVVHSEMPLGLVRFGLLGGYQF